MKLTELHIQIMGLAIIFYIVLTIGFSLFFELFIKAAKAKVKNPIEALEFIRKIADVKKITGDDEQARTGLKIFLQFDTFAFIPLYFAFLLVMSFFMSQSDFDWANTAALAIAAAATVTAIADFTENFYSYKALETDFSNPDESTNTVFIAAYVKWFALFTATGIVALFFLRGGFWNVITIIMSAASIAGIVCLFLYRRGIVLILTGQLLILLLIGITFLFHPGGYGFCKAIEFNICINK